MPVFPHSRDPLILPVLRTNLQPSTKVGRCWAKWELFRESDSLSVSYTDFQIITLSSSLLSFPSPQLPSASNFQSLGRVLQCKSCSAVTTGQFSVHFNSCYFTLSFVPLLASFHNFIAISFSLAPWPCRWRPWFFFSFTFLSVRFQESEFNLPYLTTSPLVISKSSSLRSKSTRAGLSCAVA